MAMLFVTHDLGVIADLCDRVAVMYAGQIVEEASVHDLFARPQHPYTEGLLGAMPQVGQLERAPHGDPRPGAAARTRCRAGCRFAARCDYAIDECRARTGRADRRAEAPSSAASGPTSSSLRGAE